MNHTGRRRKHFTRAETIRFHAMRRCAQRISPIGPRKYAALVEQIRDGRSQFLSRRSHRLTRHLVDVDGVPAVACYDAKRKLIVTFWRYDKSHNKERIA